MKIVAWLSKLLLAALLISTISVMTTAYIVNTYITQLLKPFNLSLSQNPLALSDIFSNFWGKPNILGQGGAGTEGSATDGTALAERDAVSTPPVGEEDSVATWAQSGSLTESESARSSSSASGSELDRAVVMSEDQLQSKKDRLSTEDKTIIFTALSKLPEADMQTISTLVEDGITSSELAQVEKIVERQLKPEEYKQLLEILKKYE